MVNNISKEELAILAYLHEHARGFTEAFPFVPAEVAAAMDRAVDQFLKDASYLEAHGLVGMNVIDASSSDGPSFIHMDMWLTGDGENFVRELEQQPGIARRITTKTVGAIYDAGREIVVRVLGDFLSGRVT